MKGPSRNPELKFIGKVPVFSLESSIFVVLNLTAKGLIVYFKQNGSFVDKNTHDGHLF